MKITYDDLKKLFSFDTEQKYCFEIDFCVLNDPVYNHSWMGKMPNEKKKEQDLYWFGLVADGSQAYDYDSFEKMCLAPVFNGKCLKELLHEIDIFSINGCDPGEMIHLYLSSMDKPSIL